jgi:lysophospholipase L1-like esterase
MRIYPLALVCLCAVASFAQSRLPITEKIEWTWTDRAEKPDAALPNVLLVGDSITRGYFPAVSEQLKGVANIYLFATSTADDTRLPAQLHDYFSMMGVKFAVVHFNNGMHGWGYTEAEYAAGLLPMINALHAGAPTAKLIWTSTTPVRKDSATGGATNARIDERNRLAAAIVARQKLPIDDQHALMLPHADLHSDDVHFKEEGSAMQAAQVAAAVRAALDGR